MAAQNISAKANLPRWKKFLREVKAELKKVSWPNRKELVAYTGVVFVSVLVVALMVWIVDAVFSEALKAILTL